MTTKEKLVRLFEEQKGIFFSGEEMAQTLGVTRAAVWKAVKALREEGYPIDAAPNKGYRLSEEADILSEQGVRHYLRGAAEQLTLLVQPEVTSTNTLLRQQANQGAPEGTVLLVGGQSDGRGRYGRSFYSPEDTGLYLSLLLRPKNWTPQDAVKLTTMAAVALCEAIRSMGVEDVGIKWVNDLFVRGKKACGILTEASFGMESGLLEYAVLGVGVNVYPPNAGFPAELEPIAGAVFDHAGADRKNRLAAEFLNRMMECYAEENSDDYIDRYRAYSLALGKTVQVLSQEGEREAKVLGIDDRCRLLVRYPDGREDCLSYGEIRIRMEEQNTGKEKR